LFSFCCFVVVVLVFGNVDVVKVDTGEKDFGEFVVGEIVVVENFVGEIVFGEIAVVEIVVGDIVVREIGFFFDFVVVDIICCWQDRCWEIVFGDNTV